jgi:type IV secretory pathway TraG/TraD family ATPase VirD4
MTRRERAKRGRVVYLNPYKAIFAEGTGLDFPDTGFNPLAVLDPDFPTFKADCDAVARYIMVTGRESSESYWTDEGTAYLSLMIASILLYHPKEDHNLALLYAVVRESPKDVAERLKHIIEEDHPALRYEAEGFLGIVLNAGEQWQGAVRKAATSTARYAPSTPLGEHTKIDGFNPLDLKRENVTVYLLVPSGQLPNALPWMNLVIGCFGIAVGRPGEARSVTLLIDEAPSLGYLPDLLPWMAQFRKVGLRVWIFSQTISQLSARDLYGKDGFDAIFGLCAIKQFFAISEPDTARLVSDLCGEKTARNVSANDSGANVGEVGVPLIRPEAVRGLKKWRQIIVMDAMQKPIRARLVPYFKRRKWRDMTDKNPYRK